MEEFSVAFRSVKVMHVPQSDVKQNEGFPGDARIVW